MFDNLSTRLGAVFDRLRGRGALSEADVGEAMREIRVALLEADVALPVVKDFVGRVRERAVGQEVLRSITPGQMVVKIVHDELVASPGLRRERPRASAARPAVILMAGLQGSGKTTTAAKIARQLRLRERKKVLLASLDTQRPAAQHQLEVLARQVEVAALPIVPGQGTLDIARRALETARREGYDVLILDTAGRLSIDEGLMAELVQVRDLARPHETLLVADALTGQDAVNTARIFNERVGDQRHRADPHGRRRARRCRAVDARTSPASRSSSPAWARSWRRSSPSTPSGWRRASSTWATWSRWSSRPPRASTATRPRSWRRSCRRAASTSGICAPSSSRCARWAG